MNLNRALTNYVSHLESDEWELREKLEIPPTVLEEGVTWCFPFFDIENKETLQSLVDYIGEKIEWMKDIGECILFLKTDGEKGDYGSEAASPEERKEKATGMLKDCLEKTRVSKEMFIEECELYYNSILDDYKELVGLIEYLMKYSKI